MMKADDTILPPDEREKGFKARFIVLKLFFLLFFAAVGFRLVQVQVIDAARFRELGRRQYEQKFTLPAVRGNIYDRNGNVLVSNTRFVSFAADPKIVGGKSSVVARAFAKVFGRPVSAYAERLSAKNKRFVWLERSVLPTLAARIEELDLPGIVMMNEPKRLYHFDHLGGTLLGFTDVDTRGISGLELSLDRSLRGVNGSVTLQQDGLGRSYSSVDYPRTEPVNGASATLTIDVTLQAVVEEELRRGIDLNQADGGLAVFMNPRTGEILALAVSPGINPNRASRTDLALARNRVVTDMFEPGSVFKVVTAAAAFEHRVISPEKRYFAEQGKMRVRFGRYVRTIRDTREHDWLTFRQAIEVSSNIVMAKAALEIGEERLYTTARDFGFGMLTGVDMTGEVEGVLKRPRDWSKTTLQTLSYGYEVGVTPLQILTAYGVVANGGVLMKPYVVGAVHDERGDIVWEQHPETIRKVVSPETATLLAHAFEGVVERGSAMDVMIPGIRVAGKTGTARKVVDGAYARGHYTASFVGFFPVDDPQMVGLVMMDNPRKNGYFGGITSGPVFRAIAERVVNASARMSRTIVTRQDPMKEKSISVPDVRQMQADVARGLLSNLGLTVRTFGDGSLVARQKPDPGKVLEAGDLVNLVLGASGQTKDGTIIVPDVRGMTIRRAMNRLVVDDFDVAVRGSGVVRRQFPASGSKERVGSRVILDCEPVSLSEAVLY